MGFYPVEHSVVSEAICACRAEWFGVAVYLVLWLTDDTSERRKEEEKEESVQHGHTAGAEKEQKGDGVWAETRQGEGRNARTREAT